MSTEENPSFSTLPIELIYKIFTYLDAQTIVRQVRCVSKRFYALVKTYDQYDFNFNSIFKRDFLLLCNYLEHDKIVLLTLSDDDQTPGQMEYFLSLFRIGQFTQLRSLTLLEIDHCYLSIILQDIKTSQLNSLIIRSQRDFSENNNRVTDLSTILSLRTLRKLHLKIAHLHVSGMSWPIASQIQHLEITCPTMSDFYHILRHFPNLRILVIEQLTEQINDGQMENLNDLEPFARLQSLTVKSRQC